MTIKEIAELSGVSTATVSYVINNSKNVAPEKKKRILEVIAEKGYQPNRIAKSLRVKSTSTIGVLVEDVMGFPVPAIINGISEYAEQSGYHILLNDLRMLESLFNQYDQICKHKEKINEAISLLLFGASVDAIIYVGMFDRDISDIINEIRKPLVIAYSTITNPGSRYVTYDNQNVSAEAVRHLIGLGHERIAVITGLAHSYPARMRMNGIQRAFKEAGLVLDNAFVKNGDWEYASGYARMKELLEQEPRLTALFAMNDLLAAGAMDAISAAGLSVPGDISVIGFDNREMSMFLKPRLTTIGIDLKGIGLASAKLAIDMISDPQKAGKSIVIPSELIIRETTAPLSR